MTDWAEIRKQFPALREWVYFNTATYGQVPERGVAAVARHFGRRDELACSDFLQWFDDADRLRGKIAKLINAGGPDDICFCGNAASALSVLLSGLEWEPGDQCVTLENEFPNNLYAPWFTPGVEFVQTPWERFYEAITARTRLVIVSLLNYSTGFRAPVEEIAPYLRERGILLFVDGTQGVGAVRFDTAAVQPSMLAVHGYKWLLSPTGAGFFYIDPQLRDRVKPNVVGWRSHKDWRNVDNLHHGKPEFTASAEKYEGGMVPHALLYAMEESIDMMLEIGPENIESRVLSLACQVRAILREAGAEVADGQTPIITGRFEGRDVSQLAQELQKRRVVAAARHGRLRVSSHFYNDESDLEKLRESLA